MMDDVPKIPACRTAFADVPVGVNCTTTAPYQDPHQNAPKLMVSVFTSMTGGCQEQWVFPLVGNRMVLKAYIAEKVSEYVDRYAGEPDGEGDGS